jgi:3-oxoacyl-[acyl-carrier protein] reductase
MSEENAAMTLKEEIALVTGASRGIGQAIARRLGALGASIVGTATTEPGAAAIQADFDSNNVAGLGLCLNVTDPASVDAAMKRIQERFGSPSVLVNNAGITRDNLLMRMKDDEWQSVIDTNLTSVFRLSKACLRGMMKARRGRIVNIASVVGSTGNPGQTNYSAAKAGILGFTRSLIDTDMTRELPQTQREALIAQVPLGCLGAVDDIANAVAFLASSQAGYITGETLHVNGGMHMA